MSESPLTEKKPFRYFQCFACVVFSVFIVVMVIVTTTAYARKSGSTGLSMFKVHKMRIESSAIPLREKKS